MINASLKIPIAVFALFTCLVMFAPGAVAQDCDSIPDHFTVLTTEDYYPIVVDSVGSICPIDSCDEIAVFDGDLCVGATVFLGGWPISIKAWRDDELTQGVIDGCVCGNDISFRIWRSDAAIEELAIQAVYTQGNGTFCSYIFAQTFLTIDDIVPPVIEQGPTDTESPCLTGLPACDGTAVTAVDNCPGDVYIECSQSLAGNTVTRTWVASDAAGNSSDPWVQHITILDTEGPQITCPPDVTVASGGSTDPDETGHAVSSDNCDPDPTEYYTDDPAGNTIVRSWVAVDEMGNQSPVCQQIITIAPDSVEIDCPPDDWISNLCGPQEICIPVPVSNATIVAVSPIGAWFSDELCFTPDTSGNYEIEVIASNSTNSDTCVVVVGVGLHEPAEIECPTDTLSVSLVAPGQVCVSVSIANAVIVSVSGGGTWNADELCFMADTSGTYEFLVTAEGHPVCATTDECTVIVDVALAPHQIECPTDTFTTEICQVEEVCIPLAIANAIQVDVTGGGTWDNGLLCFVPPQEGFFDFTVTAYGYEGDPVVCQLTARIIITAPVAIDCPATPIPTAANLPGQVCVDLAIASAMSVSVQGGNWSDGQLCFLADSIGLYTLTVTAYSWNPNCAPVECFVQVDVTEEVVINCPADPIVTQACASHGLCVDLAILNATQITVDNGGTWALDQLCFTPDTSGVYVFHVVADNGISFDECDVIVDVSVIPAIVMDCPQSPVNVVATAPGEVCVDLFIEHVIAVTVDNNGVWDNNQICFPANSEGDYIFHVMAENECDTVECLLTLSVGFDSNCWELTINAVGEIVDQLPNTDEVVIGVCDEVSQIRKPLPPPSYTTYIQSYLPEFADGPFQRDVRAYNGSDCYYWIIELDADGQADPPANRCSQISWDPSELHPDGGFRLLNGFDPANPEATLIADMRTTDSYTVCSDDGIDFMVVIWCAQECDTIDLAAGWNLLSLPLIPADPGPAAVFPGFEDVYRYDVDSVAYVEVDALEPCIGYWVYYPFDPAPIEVCGVPVHSCIDDLDMVGWHLRGAPWCALAPDFIPSVMCLQELFMFGPMGYELVSGFQSWRGQWVWLDCVGTLVLDCGSSATGNKDLVESQVQEDACFLLLEARGQPVEGSIDYASAVIGTAAMPVQALAPPDPPDYSVSVKVYGADWSGPYQSLVQRADVNLKTWILAVNPAGNSGGHSDRSVTVTWEPGLLGGDHYELRAGHNGDGKVLIEDMSATASLTISGTAGDQYFTILRSAQTPTDVDGDHDQMPVTYFLDQCYPNPFNPTTAIRFGLARAGYVHLAVYNTIGQKVATLVSEILSAGPHSISWNGVSDQGYEMATGVYYYRLDAGDYRESRKMVLMK